MNAGPRIGSLCTGYGGLDMAVRAVLGGELAWFAEVDPDASRVLAHHWPDVPNLGDLTAVDWNSVEPVDVVCAGYPCQPFSVAGLRKGVEDDRHIWPYIAGAVRVLRPRLVVLENVRGHLGRGFTAVLGDLAALGFDASWTVVRASDVGAPHRRERLFVLATTTDATDHERGRSTRHRRPGPAHGGVPAADAEGPGLETGRQGLPGTGAPADAPGDGWDEGRPEPARLLGRPDAALGRAAPPANTNRDAVRQQPGSEPGSGRTAVAGLAGTEASADAEGRGDSHQQGDDPPAVVLAEPGPGGRDRPGPDTEGTGRPGDDSRLVAWGEYEPAIRRWEHATGRAAPAPTEPGRTGPRLSPAFVEWLMGLPAGHVTAVPGISRNAMLRILGNGVVPQQAAAALALLLNDMEAAA